MAGHQEVEAVLHGHQQVLSVVDVYVEFSLESVVHHDAGLDADFVIFTVPVGLVSDWHSVPPVWIVMSQPFAYASNDSLSKYVWLLVGMVVVGIWIVESPHWHLHQGHWVTKAHGWGSCY